MTLEIQKRAWECLEWPDSLRDQVEDCMAVSIDMDMSTEQVVAYAILMERKRCSELAKGRWEKWGHTKKDDLWRVDVASCDDISSAILSDGYWSTPPPQR